MGLRFHRLGLGVVACLTLAACLGDPVGPGGMAVLQSLAGAQDSMLLGAPGRLLPRTLSWRLVDAHGNPLPGSRLEWTVVQGGGRLTGADSIVGADGVFRAGWVLGTHAADSQAIQVSAYTAGGHVVRSGARATAVPVEVASLRMLPETLDVHLGVPLGLAAIATDSFGNTFVPHDLTFASLDTAGARVDSNGTVSMRRRGYMKVQAKASNVTSVGLVHGVQTVQSIVVDRDTLLFHALSQQQPLQITILDDHGLVVADTSPVVTLDSVGIVAVRADSAWVVQSVNNGGTVVSIAVGSVTRNVVANVSQRTATLAFNAPNLRFDALNDTVRLTLTPLDSQGVVVAKPRIALTSTDTSVATIDTFRLVTARANGTVTVTARTPFGVSTSIPVTVSQQVAAVSVPQDTIRFDALKAVLGAGAVPRDRLGSPVGTATVAYAVRDTGIATVDSTGAIHARANGMTSVVASSNGDSAVVTVKIQQRPVRVVLSQDTIRFDAFGESAAISATALDSLGSPLTGSVTSLRLSDTTVAQESDTQSVRPVANGTTTASFTVAGFAASVPVVVNQIATKLSVAAEDKVFSLPVGALLPLSCQALDKNSFTISREPSLTSSLRGTVGGADCGSARVQHSGYDTLSFAMNGLQARVGVIVSTTPDTAAVLVSAAPLTTVSRDSFVGENLTSSLVQALRPLVSDILAAYGNPGTNLDRARALRDWVARTAVHPWRGLHPDTSTANLSVLPPGTTWADVNAAASPKVNLDPTFWGTIGLNGYSMLDSLLGTLNRSTGQRADNGLMVHVQGAQYRIRDINAFHYVICSYQSIILSALWEAAGLQGMMIETVDHDPAAVFIPELGRWVYEDPTWDDEYLLGGAGDPLSPVDLLTLSSNGQVGSLVPVKQAGPNYDPAPYITGDSYVHDNPSGFVIMGSQLNNRLIGIVGRASWPLRHVQINVPALALYSPFNDPRRDDPVTADVAFPTLGVVVQSVQSQDSVLVTQLGSTFPTHDHFERRVNGGAWTTVSAQDVLPVGQTLVEYRSVDALGNVSGTTSLNVWVPRTAAFVSGALPGSIRAQAQFYP